MLGDKMKLSEMSCLGVLPKGITSTGHKDLSLDGPDGFYFSSFGIPGFLSPLCKTFLHL